MRNSISEYLNLRSNEASNRRVKNPEFDDQIANDEHLPARYLDDNKIALYKEWNINGDQQKPSLTTFKKYLNKKGIYKKPYRWTDLCEYCESLRKLKIKLPNDLANLGYIWPNNLSYTEDSLREHFQNAVMAKRYLKNKQNDGGADVQQVDIL